MAVSSVVHPLRGNQGAASDPTRHVWLSASAGTGKTQVLAARVYRLLLRGVDPSAILCLTFTKAGAAEMASRISGTLARWVRADSAALFHDLEALGEASGPDEQRRARTLFAKVLDAPGGGLRIQTIHGFCQSLLAGFPVEAGLVPGFRPLDAREEVVLAREALAAMLVDEEAVGRTRLVDAVGALSLRLGEGGAEAFLLACARAPDAMVALPSGVQPWLRRALDLPTGDISEEIAAGCSDDAFDVESLRQVADANHAWGTATGAGHAATVERWLAAAPAERAATLPDLASVFRTGKGEPRKASAKLLAINVDYADMALDLGDRCAELVALADRAAYADLLAGALDAGRAYADAYRAAKRRLGGVDFDDLIRATVALLDQPGMGDWIRFKLDQATDHLLIDEAQDTNPAQWRIVRALADEFFAGEGARGEVGRTLFTVGDYKQAIFGFQGTSPIYFAAAHQHFERASIAADEDGREEPRLTPLSLTSSFRSTRPVLEFVDAAIDALPEPGLGVDEREPHASEIEGPGSVALWTPTVAGGDDDAEEGWVDDATLVHARRIASAVKGWIGTLPLDSKGRMLAPEDVMILVKRRGDLAALIVARLYAEGVPVAGVDRLRLNAPLAVQDLLAAMRFVLQPDDDLSLASLLVSPLIGWTQDELMHAAMRERGGLWRHLRKTQDEARLQPLTDMLGRADFTTPYRFLEDLLSGPLDGRRKLLARLGEEARDPIEELLGAALTFEGNATPSLQRFLDWFDRGDVEIVRDPSAPLDAVRVMTAHGAKGLQAPLVILADATADPANVRRDILKWDVEGVALPVFRPRGAERVGSPLDAVVAEAERRELEEHWRLFYVAATRAEERLVVTGALSPRMAGEAPAASWYAAATRAFDALGVAGDGEREFVGSAPALPVKARAPRAVADAAVPLPDWARAPAPQEARPPRPLAPSAIGDDAVADPPPTPAMRAAAERGRLIHALFERLPAVAPDRRRAAALRWLEHSGAVADAAAREEIADAVCGVIADPRFADLFGPDSLAEAPIAATVGGSVIAGTVDRLVVADDAVRVVDFKTGRRVPATAADIPPYHLRQMGAYAAALAVIFPDRAVSAALLYASGPALFEIEAATLAAHKPGLPATEQSLPSRA
ncbi:double-strand break repair helicase AddA [Sphingomonas donggukensis]|uniref:DNA 3'-5' helicase n=1 Tax=Sphingomonas donggukensis TaxID=2949093 RepID=A0ABY4TVE8_9SPHN|nr:double-strand break repair helicase AddA [Sphingomonas donggukensis]URW76308.1 double-strand break repair helicase AddA [Sphingomonas donggukensis]